jgi:hypothetical protein
VAKFVADKRKESKNFCIETNIDKNIDNKI